MTGLVFRPLPGRIALCSAVMTAVDRPCGDDHLGIGVIGLVVAEPGRAAPQQHLHLHGASAEDIAAALAEQCALPRVIEAD